MRSKPTRAGRFPQVPHLPPFAPVTKGERRAKREPPSRLYAGSARRSARSLRLYCRSQQPDACAALYQRIEKFCIGLRSLPERGTRRDDLRPGLRVIGFERRVLIAFQVDSDTVAILRILYGGRNVELAFPEYET